jgi:hypothetical protein
MATLATVTMPMSGVEIRIRRTPFEVIQKINAKGEALLADAKPTPPVRTVQTGPDHYEHIPDPTDADYLAQMIEWKKAVAVEVDRLAIELIASVGIVHEMTDDDRATIAQMRESYGLFVDNLPANDRVFWVKYIVAPTHEDYMTLLWEVFGRSAPSEAQVTFHRTLFRRPVQGPADRVVQAPEGASDVQRVVPSP